MLLEKVDHTICEEITIGDINALVLRPNTTNNKKRKTIIFYHGWSSCKESQRLRAYILASFGYQVIIPDAKHHGSRGSLDYLNKDVACKYFWDTVLSNIEESSSIIKYAIDNLQADKDNIAVSGNSMGGITSSGVLIKHSYIKTAVIMNGSCNYRGLNKKFLSRIELNKDLQNELEKLEKTLDLYDPYQNIEKIDNRKILILHGKKDSIVDINPQIEFVKKMKSFSRDNISFIQYERLNHFVTTNMMEEALIWFEDQLK